MLMKLLKITAAVIFLIVIRSNSIASPVGEAQQMLNQLSYNAGPADGAYGKKTRKALEKFYRDIDTFISYFWKSSEFRCHQCR